MEINEVEHYTALDWMIRTFTPAWLDVAGLTAEGQALRNLDRIDSPTAVAAATPVVFATADKASAHRDAGAMRGFWDRGVWPGVETTLNGCCGEMQRQASWGDPASPTWGSVDVPRGSLLTVAYHAAYDCAELVIKKACLDETPGGWEEAVKPAVELLLRSLP